MRLVACHVCHAQFDVTDVTIEQFTCRCGAEVKNEKLRAVDADVHRCSSCGAIVATDAADCAYCGSEIVRDHGPKSLICPECYARNADESRFCTACGVAFRPEAVPVDGHELPCPCCGVLMPVAPVASVPLNECPKCRGLWVPGEHFDALIARATEQRRQAGPGGREAPRVKGSNPARQQVLYRKCPVCEAFMQRRNFQKTSGVIVDRCRDHGTWLDADELEQIAGFVLSGGRPQASATMAKLEAQAEAEYRDARRFNATRPVGSRLPQTYDKAEVGFSLLGLLHELLD